MDIIGFIALLLVVAEGVIAEVQVEPQNATVLQHSEARFNCSVSNPGWAVMIWSLNRVFALTILETSGVVNSTGHFYARNYSTAGKSRWELIIENVLREDSGQVVCQILGGEPVTAELSVQESGAVEIVGSNRTVTEGERVVFQCLAAGWFPAPRFSWALNGAPVADDLFNSSSVETGAVVNSSSSLSITASSSMRVECLATVPALGTPRSSCVYLTAVKAVEPQTRDQTVLIAVTVSFSAAALLVLFIIAVVFCCKRRKRAKSGYEKEARAQSQRVKNTHTGEGQGHDNLGYVTEGPKVRDSNSDFTDSRYWHNSNSFQMPDVVRTPHEASHAASTVHVSDSGVRKHRHVTIV
ncbi:immunoglobulin superfamily member 5 isoform X1 [Brachyhypopomus gauderio]|uniref:immunoglobulin superfamily member 5 isoform X1 n=1 Tax=Brachyhypopomus gauderio TaxID=698409 RepID=UPI0040438703